MILLFATALSHVNLSCSHELCNRASIHQPLVGYSILIVSNVLYGLSGTLYKYFFDGEHDSPTSEEKEKLLNSGNSTQRFSGVALSAVQQTLDILGFMGLVGFIFGLLLPVLTLLDVEEFQWPHQREIVALSATAMMDGAFNLLFILGILLSSPLFMTVGSILTIPVAVVADMIVHHYVMPWLGFLGIALIVLGFLGLNLSEVLLGQSRSQLSPTDITPTNT